MVRRQRRAEHDCAVRRFAVLQASPDHRHQREGRPEDRCALRLAEVDGRHEAAVRRGQRRHRAGRGLRPAVVLALHVDVVLAHRRAEQRQPVRLGRADRIGTGSERRPRQSHREHLRQSEPRRQGGEARATRVSRSGEVSAWCVRAGKITARFARCVDNAGWRRAPVRARGDQERRASVGSCPGGVERLQRQEQSGPATAGFGQGRGAHRG